MNSLYRVNTFGERGRKRFKKPGIRICEDRLYFWRETIMRKSFFISVIVGLLIFVVSSDSFGDNRWISIGPEGGSVFALAINPETPDTLYAGTDGGGVFKIQQKKRDEIMGTGGTWSSGIWYYNLATMTWSKPFGSTPSGPIAVGDVTGDGKADMVSCWPSGLWYQNGATLAWTNVYSVAPSQVAVGDITGN
jgi:hypothetical protein